MASFNLTVACSPYNKTDKRNIRVFIKCTSDTIADTCIFAYSQTGAELTFSHVCSTVDMVEYPKATDEAPANFGESFKWFRKDYVDLIVPALSIAEDFIREVISDVKMLYKNMKAHNAIVTSEPITYKIDDDVEIIIPTETPVVDLPQEDDND